LGELKHDRSPCYYFIVDFNKKPLPESKNPPQQLQWVLLEKPFIVVAGLDLSYASAWVEYPRNPHGHGIVDHEPDLAFEVKELLD